MKEYFLERVRKSFASRSPEQLNSGTVPIELIELVAHEMRWPELLKLAQERIGRFFGGDEKLAIGDISRRLAEAYEDNWQDREFYSHYRC